MGIFLDNLNSLAEAGYLRNGDRFLDIGSSNLYLADQKKLVKLFELMSICNIPSNNTLEKWVSGSQYSLTTGVANGTFVGEILEYCEIEYLSFDVAHGYNTKIFDLNYQKLPRKFDLYFDVVANYGTTEHVMNQLNAFNVIHQATRVGGVMIHTVPIDGFIDHCYVSYTPRFFFDLATVNGYEILELKFGKASEGLTVYDPCNDFKKYFPSLENTINHSDANLSKHKCKDIFIEIILRKTNSKNFIPCLETTTSVNREWRENNFFRKLKSFWGLTR